MKIGIVTNHFDCGGGGQQCIHQITEALKNKHDITGIAVQEHRDNLLDSDFVLSGDFESSLKYLNIMSDVIIHWANIGEYNFKKPLIFISMGASPWTKQATELYKHQTIKNVAVSKVAGQFFDSEYTIIHPYVDEERLYGRTVSFGDNVIGYLGRISTEKGIYETVEMIKDTKWKLVLAFTPINTKVEETILENVLKTIPDQVELYTPKNNVGPVIRSFDVMSILSPSEGFCMSAAESLYCGVPILCNRTGFMAEYDLPDYHFGNNVDNLDRLVLKKKHNKQLYKDIASNFTKEVHEEKWLDLIESVEHG